MIKQHEMNAVYGGIHPLKAQGLHAQNIVSLGERKIGDELTGSPGLLSEH